MSEVEALTSAPAINPSQEGSCQEEELKLAKGSKTIDDPLKPLRVVQKVCCFEYLPWTIKCTNGKIAVEFKELKCKLKKVYTEGNPTPSCSIEFTGRGRQHMNDRRTRNLVLTLNDKNGDEIYNEDIFSEWRCGTLDILFRNSIECHIYDTFKKAVLILAGGLWGRC